MATQIELKEVNIDLIDEYNKRFQDDNRYFLADKAIIKLINQFPTNSNIEDILLKVVTINELYSTNVYATFEIAKHILKLNIDNDIKNGNLELVNKIAKLKLKDKEKTFYSFASKYCNWHNSKNFPIYDSFVDRLLSAYQKQDTFLELPEDSSSMNFFKLALKNYEFFKETIDSFIKYYELGDVNYKKIDKFLWMYGKELFGKNN